MKTIFTLALTSILALQSCAGQPRVKTGADVLVEKHLHLIEGKRIGLITNQTGRLSGGEFLADVLLARSIKVVALFSPEHGIRGEAGAGDIVDDMRDSATGLPVFSLYGKTRKPAPEMLSGVDVLVYDIQDVGTRFYTYISTMALAMEAAAEARLPFIVLDRPNPIGFLGIDGPIIEDSLRSFVGMLPVPVVYGLTCGELAEMINWEGWLPNGLRADLKVVPIENWHRSMSWSETGLVWVKPSPAIPTSQTTVIYPAICFVEATNVSEGRGTARPFESIGAPFINADTLSATLNELRIPGLTFSAASFTPSSSKFKNELCNGVEVTVTDASVYRPVSTGFHILQTLLRLYPSSVEIRLSSLKRLLGSTQAAEMVVKGEYPDSITATWAPQLERFRRISSRYRRYED